MPKNGGENDHSSFLTVGTRQMHDYSSNQLTIDTIRGASSQQYIDLEDYNTSATQTRHRQALLNMNVDKLKRKKPVKPKVHLDGICF